MTPEEQAEQAEKSTQDSNEEINTSDKPEKEYDALHMQHLRLAADFENYRKRQGQEREQLFKYGAQSTLEALLPVLDNLERAKQGLNENADPKMLYKSFEMLSTQLLDALKNAGLEKMTPIGQAFDPQHHEAVSQQEDNDKPEHTVIQIYQDGYMLKDKVLRPAQVVVSVQGQGAVEQHFDPSDADQVKDNPFQHSVAEA